MALRPTCAAGQVQDPTLINRVAKISQFELIDPSPDTLTLVKREIDTLDQLEISDNATYLSRLAAMTEDRARRAFYGGNIDRLMYRYALYGMDDDTLSRVLYQLQVINLPQLTAWLSWANATDTGTLIVPDRLGGAAATQSVGALKPTIGLSDNGVKIGTFSAHVLSLPLSAAINNNTKFGIAFWAKIADVSGIKSFATVILTAGGASANKLSINTFGATLEARAQTVDRRAGIGSLDTNWRFCYIGIDCGKGTEATQVIMSLDGAPGTVAFSSDTAWPSSLGTPTGNMLIGATTTAAASPLVGSIADIFFFSDQLSSSDVGRLMNFNRPL